MTTPQDQMRQYMQLIESANSPQGPKPFNEGMDHDDQSVITEGIFDSLINNITGPHLRFVDLLERHYHEGLLDKGAYIQFLSRYGERMKRYMLSSGNNIKGLTSITGDAVSEYMSILERRKNEGEISNARYISALRELRDVFDLRQH
jgi:hypothetical protein